MKINLLADYRGILTNEQYYLAGEHDLPAGIAQALVDEGRAESLEKAPEPEPAKSAAKRGAKK